MKGDLRAHPLEIQLQPKLLETLPLNCYPAGLAVYGAAAGGDIPTPRSAPPGKLALLEEHLTLFIKNTCMHHQMVLPFLNRFALYHGFARQNPIGFLYEWIPMGNIIAFARLFCKVKKTSCADLTQDTVYIVRFWVCRLADQASLPGSGM